jgi:hypothetical protein
MAKLSKDCARPMLLPFFSNLVSACCFINQHLRASILHQMQQVNQNVLRLELPKAVVPGHVGTQAGC